jgi:hypothetical protein
VNNNASNARRNTTLVMTTPYTRSTNVKTLDKRFGTNQEQIFSAYSHPIFGDNGDCYGGNRSGLETIAFGA